jgi:hypothetical protein
MLASSDGDASRFQLERVSFTSPMRGLLLPKESL